jgi:hypothetical protein
MRLIQQKAWTHPAISTTPGSVWHSTNNFRHSPTPAQLLSSREPQQHPTQVPSHGGPRAVAYSKTQVTAAQMAVRATQPTPEPVGTNIQTNNIRRFATG